MADFLGKYDQTLDVSVWYFFREAGSGRWVYGERKKFAQTRFIVFFFLKAATLLLLSSSVGMLVQKLGTFKVMEVEEREIKMGGKGVLRFS